MQDTGVTKALRCWTYINRHKMGRIMRNLFTIPLLLISLSFATPSYSSSLLCGTVGIGCKKVDWSEVVLRNGYVYKKFATEKFTSVNQTKNIQFHARQCTTMPARN